MAMSSEFSIILPFFLKEYFQDVAVQTGFIAVFLEKKLESYCFMNKA